MHSGQVVYFLACNRDISVVSLMTNHLALFGRDQGGYFSAAAGQLHHYYYIINVII